VEEVLERAGAKEGGRQCAAVGAVADDAAPAGWRDAAIEYVITIRTVVFTF